MTVSVLHRSPTLVRRLIVALLVATLLGAPLVAAGGPRSDAPCPATVSDLSAPSDHHHHGGARAALHDHHADSADRDAGPSGDPTARDCLDCCIGCLTASGLPARSVLATAIDHAADATMIGASDDRLRGRSIRPDPGPPRPSA